MLDWAPAVDDALLHRLEVVLVPCKIYLHRDLYSLFRRGDGSWRADPICLESTSEQLAHICRLPKLTQSEPCPSFLFISFRYKHTIICKMYIFEKIVLKNSRDISIG